VVVFPRNEASLEVLVAHLGRISLTNQRLTAWDLLDTLPQDTAEVDRYSITINSINLTSLNILAKLQPKSSRTLEGKFSRNCYQRWALMVVRHSCYSPAE
jgi:hypothetical protein